MSEPTWTHGQALVMAFSIYKVNTVQLILLSPYSYSTPPAREGLVLFVLREKGT